MTIDRSASTGTRPLVRLLLGNRTLMRAVVPLVIASFAAILLLGLLSAARLSPEQFVEREFGAADGLTPISSELEPGQPIPAFQLPDAATAGPVALTASLQFEGASGWMSYHEVALPDRLSGYRNVELRHGRWPMRPGEVVLTPAAQAELGPTSPRPVAGQWSLTVVGTAIDRFAANGTAVYAAPGTWEAWKLDPATNYDDKARVQVFWTSPDPAKVVADSNSMASGAVQESSLDRYTYYDRRDTGWSAQSLLERQLPALLLIVVAATATGGLLGRWLRRIAAPLSVLGVPRSTVIPALITASGFAAVGAGVIGVLDGDGALLIARPVLASQLDRPLSPWTWQPGMTLAAVIMAPIIVAMITTMIAIAKPKARRQHVLSPRMTRRLVITAAVTAAVGAVASVLGVRSFWAILIIVLGVSCSAAALAPALLALLITRVREISPRLAAARALVADFGAHALRIGVAAFLVVLAGSTPAIAGASFATLNTTSSTGLPPGIAVVTLKDDQYDLPPLNPDALKRFEADVGIDSPVPASAQFKRNPVHTTWVFRTQAEVERVFGTLTPDQATALAGGKLALLTTPDPPSTALAVPWNFSRVNEVRLGAIDHAVRPILIYTRANKRAR